MVPLMQTEKTDCVPHRGKEGILCSSEVDKKNDLVPLMAIKSCSYNHKEDEGVQLGIRF